MLIRNYCGSFGLRLDRQVEDHMKQADRTMVSRRRLMLGAAAFSLAASEVGAQPQQGYSRVAVDVSRFRSLGGGVFADLVQANLAAAMQRHFVGRIGIRGAPALAVQIRSMSLGSHVGGDGSSWRLGGGASDYLDGEAVVLQGSQVMLRHPQLLTLPASGAWYDPDNERRRAVALCDGYASWLARSI
jgi:hypothetical protein